MSDPVGSWSWYLSRFDQVLEKQPNPAHTALAHGTLATRPRWRVCTGHTKRGPAASGLAARHWSRCMAARIGRGVSKTAVSIPAIRIRRQRHAGSHSIYGRAKPRSAAALYRLQRAFASACVVVRRILPGAQRLPVGAGHGCSGTQDVMLFVGTSFAVGVTSDLESAIKRSVPALSITLGWMPLTSVGVSTRKRRSCCRA